MQQIIVELPDSIAATLDNIFLENNNLRQSIIQELVTRYLEDIEDTAAAMQVLERNEPTISMEKLVSELGLEN